MSRRAIIAGLMAATILFTKSRAGLLGLAAVLLVLVIEGRKLRPGLGVAALVALLLATPLMPSWFWVRLGSITNPAQDESGSRQARKDLMWEGWQTFVEHPLTGVGAGQFKNYNPPDRLEPWRETHNVLLQVAAELGVVWTPGVPPAALAGGLGAAVDPTACSASGCAEPARQRGSPGRYR